MRGRELGTDLVEAAGLRAADAARTRAFSVTTWRTSGSSSGRGGRPGRRRVGDLPQGREAQQRSGLFAAAAALAVAGVDEGVLGPGVDDQHLETGGLGVEGDLLGLAGANIEEQDVAAMQHRDAVWSSRPVMAPTKSFSVRCTSRAISGRVGVPRLVDLTAGEPEQREGDGALQRVGRGEAGAGGHVAGDDEVGAGEVDAVVAQQPGHAGRDRRPTRSTSPGARRR